MNNFASQNYIAFSSTGKCLVITITITISIIIIIIIMTHMKSSSWTSPLLEVQGFHLLPALVSDMLLAVLDDRVN